MNVTIGTLIDFEDGKLSYQETVDLFAHLVKTQLAWSLQGSYGRQASEMILAGYIDVKGNVLRYPEPEDWDE